MLYIHISKWDFITSFNFFTAVSDLIHSPKKIEREVFAKNGKGCEFVSFGYVIKFAFSLREVCMIYVSMST